MYLYQYTNNYKETDYLFNLPYSVFSMQTMRLHSWVSFQITNFIVSEHWIFRKARTELWQNLSCVKFIIDFL